MTVTASPPPPNTGEERQTFPPPDPWWLAFGYDDDPVPDDAQVAAVRRRPNLPDNGDLRSKGLWNDPGSGRFIRVGLSTRGAGIAEDDDDWTAIRDAAKTLAEAPDSDNGGRARFRLADQMFRTVGGVEKGEYVEGRYLDDDTVELTMPNGRDFQVKWARVDEVQVPETEPEGPELPIPLAQFLAGRLDKAGVPNLGGQMAEADELVDSVQRTAWPVAARGGPVDEVAAAIPDDVAERMQVRNPGRDGQRETLAEILVHNVAVARRRAEGPPLSRDNLGMYGLPTPAELREHDPELAEALDMALPDTGTDERGLSGGKAIEKFGRRGIAETLNSSAPDPVVVRFLQMHRRAALAELAGRDSVELHRGVSPGTPASDEKNPFLTGVKGSKGRGVTSWTTSTGIQGVYGDDAYTLDVPVEQILSWDSIGNVSEVQNSWDYNGHNTVPLRGIEVLVLDDPEALDRLMAGDAPFRRTPDPTPPPEVAEALEAVRAQKPMSMKPDVIRGMARWQHQNNPEMLARIDGAQPVVEVLQRWGDGRTGVFIGLRDDEGMIFTGGDYMTDADRSVDVRVALAGLWGNPNLGVDLRTGLTGVPGYETETLWDNTGTYYFQEHPDVPKPFDRGLLIEELNLALPFKEQKPGATWSTSTGDIERTVDGDNGWIDYQDVTAKWGVEDARTGEWRDITITAKMPVGFRKTTEYDLMFGPLAAPSTTFRWAIDGKGGVFDPDGTMFRIFDPEGPNGVDGEAIQVFAELAAKVVADARGVEPVPEGVFYVDDERGPNNKYDWDRALRQGPDLSPEDVQAALRFRARVTKFGSIMSAAGQMSSADMVALLAEVKDWEPTPGSPEWPTDGKANWSGLMMGRGYLSANLKALRQDPELADPDAIRFMQLLRQDFLDKTPSPAQQIRLHRGADEPGKGNNPIRYSMGRQAEPASSGVTSWSAPELNDGEWGKFTLVEDVPFDRVIGRFGTVTGEILVADDPAIIEAIDSYNPTPPNVWVPNGPEVTSIAQLAVPPTLSDDDRQALRNMLGKAVVYHRALGEVGGPKLRADGSGFDTLSKDEARLAAWDRMRSATPAEVAEAEAGMTRYGTGDDSLWNTALIQRQVLATAFLAPDGAEDPDIARVVQLMHGHLVDVFPEGKDALQLRRASAGGDGGPNTDVELRPASSGLTSWTAHPGDDISGFGIEVTEAVPLERIIGRFGAMEHEVIVTDDPAKLQRLLDYAPPTSSARARALIADVPADAFSPAYEGSVAPDELAKFQARIDEIVDDIVADLPAEFGTGFMGTPDQERIVALFPTAPQSDPTLLDTSWTDVRDAIAQSLLFQVDDDWEQPRVANRVRENLTRRFGDPSTGPLAASGFSRESMSLAAMRDAAAIVERNDPSVKLTPSDREQLDKVLAAGAVLLDDLKAARSAAIDEQPDVTPALLAEAQEAEVAARRDAAVAVQTMRREPVLAAALAQLQAKGITGVGMAPVGTEMTWKNTDRRTRLVEGARFHFSDEADIEWVLEPERTKTTPSKVKGWRLKPVYGFTSFDEQGRPAMPRVAAPEAYLVTSGPGVAATKKAAAAAEPVVLAWYDAQDYTRAVEAVLGSTSEEAVETLTRRFWDDVWPNRLPAPEVPPATPFQSRAQQDRAANRERLDRWRETSLYTMTMPILDVLAMEIGDPLVPHRTGLGKAWWKIPAPRGFKNVQLEMSHAGEAWLHGDYTLDDGKVLPVKVRIADRRAEPMAAREPVMQAINRLRASRTLAERHQAANAAGYREATVEWARENLGVGAEPALITAPRTAAQKARAKELNDKVSSFLPAAIVEALPPVDSTAISARRSKYQPGTSMLMFGTGARESTYLHEYGHHVEHNRPLAARASWAFYQARTDGEEPTHMGPGYRSWEYTREDRFYNRYAGKLYGTVVRPEPGKGRASEVLTMGLEGLFLDSAGDNGEGIDDEYAAFVLGTLLLDAEKGVTGNLAPGVETDADGGKAIERSRRIAREAAEAGYEARPIGATLRIGGPDGRQMWTKVGGDQWRLLGSNPALIITSQELRDWKAGDVTLDELRGSPGSLEG